MIAHEKQYASIINSTFYAKSLVDNLFTLGFDIFDNPRVSIDLTFIYNKYGEPSKQKVRKYYQADQLGIHEKSFVLFGWYAVGVLFIWAFLLKHLYLNSKSTNTYGVVLRRVVLFYCLARCINSFGMDWTIIEIVPYIVIAYLYIF